ALRRGDGGPQVLQRLRPAPGPEVGVRGRHPALHPVGARGHAARGARRRHAVARLHLHRQRGGRQPRRRAGAPGLRPRLRRRLREPRQPAFDRRAAGEDPGPRGDAPAHARARRRRAAHAGRREQGRAPDEVHGTGGLRRGIPAHGRLLQEDRMMARMLVGVLTAVLALGGIAGAAAAQAPARLIVQSTAEPPGLDMTATPATATSGIVFYNVQESLVKVDRHGKLVPSLAERWHTADNKNYTFFLKKGVRFHNGREMKAADVKFCFDRALNPETKHPYAKDYEAVGDIIVKDDYTVTFALKTINANFLQNIARAGAAIYPREAVDTLKSHPIGTGPFRFEEWVRGDRVVLVKNGEYHVKGLPKLDRVPFRFITDPNAVLAALKAGDIDVSLFGLGPEHVQDLLKDARFQVISGDTTNDVILSMNNSRKPYTDVRVRRAMTYGVNKSDVLKGAMFGMGKILGTNV